ncbi:MAG TPA: MaoC/PaaZ C-terminal domain-containing protein [Solirubrobacteraceae bacterium]|nr:MaoC/PaaZ C-terminal domain-containing protein [Solirubrobacteraceae bacterium]
MAERELSGPPSMLGMFARAGVSAIPGASVLPLPFVGGRGDGLPDLTLTLSDLPIDRERLSEYDRVCGFDVSDVLPPTYPHMLAFPLQLSLMTDPSFPFGAIGLVHITNRIVQHRPVTAGERVSLRVWAEDLEPHPRGQQFSLRSEARVGDELVWEEVSTNLRRGGGSGGDPARADPIPSSEGLAAAASWKLPGDLGRRYAGVSGDYNPIHVHPLSARLFGFPRAIAHGMWTKARCLATLSPRLPGAFTAEAAFRKPILLPATVEFAEGGGDAGTLFGVRDARKGTGHLDGRVSF